MTNFYCYDDGEELNLWARWFAKQDSRVKARHAVVLKMLATMNPWRNPLFHPLGNKGIGQIIIDAGVQWRVLGFHNEDRSEFTVVLTCNHKGRRYDPTNAQTTAERRMTEILTGTATRSPCVPPP